jgi:hypothetical protein
MGLPIERAAMQPFQGWVEAPSYCVCVPRVSKQTPGLQFANTFGVFKAIVSTDKRVYLM